MCGGISFLSTALKTVGIGNYRAGIQKNFTETTTVWTSLGRNQPAYPILRTIL